MSDNVLMDFHYILYYPDKRFSINSTIYILSLYAFYYFMRRKAFDYRFGFNNNLEMITLND